MITEIKTIEEFVKNGISLENRTIKLIDFESLHINWDVLKVKNTTFLGCTFSDEEQCKLIRLGAHIYNAPEALPYRPFRNSLYTWSELESGQADSRDLMIYQHFSKHRHNPSINEALWQRIHDHAIDDSLRNLIGVDDNGVPSVKCVGIMGGHSTSRKDPYYFRTALTAKRLTEQGYFVVSGGGPGIMEAANLGAFLADHSDHTLNDALEHMAKAPTHESPDYTARAIEFSRQIRDAKNSLAIPTWFYGHEPSNIFSTHIAKYFSNSIREDTLLAICLWGVIFAPGSAGTNQEIFMDACQNHYGTYGFHSPMVFLGEHHYDHETLIFHTLKMLAYGHTYRDLLFLTDDPDEIVSFIKKNEPTVV